MWRCDDALDFYDWHQKVLSCNRNVAISMIKAWIMTIDVHDWDYCTLMHSGHDISSRAWTVVVICLGRCHMPDNSSSDKFTPFLSFLCYKTYSFSKIHSIVHSNVHYCSLSFTLAIYLLSGINRCLNFAPSIRKMAHLVGGDLWLIDTI